MSYIAESNTANFIADNSSKGNIMNEIITAPIMLSTAAVVKNDSTASVPTIRIADISVPVNVAAAEDIPQAPSSKLNEMAAACRNWESTELAASNKRLYSLLTNTLRYYLTMKNDPDKNVRKAYADALTQFITDHKFTFMPSTHDMTRVVKCVFGADRRRVSAYSIALREALRQEVAADDLVAFIEQNGGVEQIRLGGTKPLSATKRAALVKAEVGNSELGTFKLDANVVATNADWNDGQVVIVATYLPTGEFQVNAVIKHESAVTAAMAGYYSQKQAKLRAQAATDKKANEAAKTAEANAAELKEYEAKKDAAMAAQIASVKEKQAEDERLVGQQAHFESLFGDATV